jgi:hypothetical protein
MVELLTILPLLVVAAAGVVVLILGEVEVLVDTYQTLVSVLM